MEKRLRVGIILSEMHHQFFSNTSRKLQEELLAMNADVCIFMATALSGMPEEYIQGETAIYDLINPDMFDGLIVYPGTFQIPERQNPFLEKIKKEYRKPVYCLERPKYGFPTVAFKEEEGIAMLVEHLIKVHGAKRIEYISNEDDAEGINKELEGYFLDAMKAGGLAADVRNIHYCRRDVGKEEQLVREMMEQEGGLPEAIICGNTESVSGFICAFEDHGIRVPRDIMICGYNLDYDEMLRGTTCTTVFRDPSAMATNAARKLVNAIPGEERYPLVTNNKDCVLVPKATFLKTPTTMPLVSVRLRSNPASRRSKPSSITRPWPKRARLLAARSPSVIMSTMSKMMAWP